MDQALKDKQTGIRKTVAALLVFIVLLLGLLVYRVTAPQHLSLDQLKELGAVVFETPRTFETAQLHDQNGKPFDANRWVGKWSLVFFGYTYCPDVCPTTLATLRSFKKALAPELLQDTQVVFVSVDPGRDTTAQLAQYVDYFDPEFIGVSGEFLDLQRFAQQLNSAFNKVPGGGENYLVDHSANIVLVNPRGDYQGFIKPPFELVPLTHAYEQLRLKYQSTYGAEAG